jgi:hypothetical protein
MWTTSAAWASRGTTAARSKWSTARTFAGGATMTNKVRKQIFVIRNTGLTNMFDVNTVQRMAHEMNFFELVVFLEEHKDQYVHFILTGEE